MDSWKMDYHGLFEGFALRTTMCALAFDLPGTGESEAHLIPGTGHCAASKMPEVIQLMSEWIDHWQSR